MKDDKLRFTFLGILFVMVIRCGRQRYPKNCPYFENTQSVCIHTDFGLSGAIRHTVFGLSGAIARISL
jgi:hypothetical protein